MAKKKITRKQLLKEPDEFLTLSDRAARFMTAHSRHLQYLGMAIAAIAIVYLAAYTYLGYINRKGQNAYNEAYYALSESMKPDLDTETLRNAGELFEKVMKDYSLSKAARLAQPQVAYVKFLDRQYDEAIGLYKAFSHKVSGDPKYESLTHLALAACYEAKGDLKAGIEALNPIVTRPKDPFRGLAMLSLARLYRLNSEPQKAKEILGEFVETYKDSPFLSFAKAHL